MKNSYEGISMYGLTKDEEEHLWYLVRTLHMPHPTVCELGSAFGGSSSKVILEYAREYSGMAYFVDWFKGDKQAFSPEMFESFANNILTEPNFDDHATVIVSNTHRAARLFQNGTLDFLFIDASHIYAEFKSNLVEWLPKVRRGGIVAGHDHDRVDMTKIPPNAKIVDTVNGKHYGVVMAVAEVIGKVEVKHRIWHKVIT